MVACGTWVLCPRDVPRECCVPGKELMGGYVPEKKLCPQELARWRH